MTHPQPGDAIPPLRIDDVAAEPMKVMALLLDDSNVIHFDGEAVARLGLGDRPINQGPTNLGYVMRMLGEWAGGEERIRSITTRFQGNVVAGDTVTATGRVTSVNAVDGETVAECEVWLDRGEGERVLHGNAVVHIPESGTRSP